MATRVGRRPPTALAAARAARPGGTLGTLRPAGADLHPNGASGAHGAPFPFRGQRGHGPPPAPPGDARSVATGGILLERLTVLQASPANAGETFPRAGSSGLRLPTMASAASTAAVALRPASIEACGPSRRPSTPCHESTELHLGGRERPRQARSLPIAEDADDFWHKVERPRAFAGQVGAGLGEYLANRVRLGYWPSNLTKSSSVGLPTTRACGDTKVGVPFTFQRIANRTSCANRSVVADELKQERNWGTDGTPAL